MWQTVAILAIVAVAGLRDKVTFLAGRGEVYGSLAVAFLFTGADIVIAAKLVCRVIWPGAATSKLNKHFPVVISTMMSNNPVFRPRWIKRRFFEHFPNDPRPGPASQGYCHFEPGERSGCRNPSTCSARSTVSSTPPPVSSSAAA